MSYWSMWLLLSLIFGLCVGSFINVIIYRLPLNQSVVLSRSACRNCHKLIYWYENIPVLSYLFLRGRCSKCQTKISIGYPVVELVVGVFAFVITPQVITFSAMTSYFFNVSLFATFLAILIIDIKHRIIPNELNIYLALLFLCAVVFVRPYWYWSLGALVGILVPLSITYLFYLLRGKIGLGGGDIKLFGALGIFLGPQGVFLNLAFSCFLGSVIMLLLIISKKVSRDTPMAFGPFIVIVAMAQIFFPEQFLMISSYLVRG